MNQVQNNNSVFTKSKKTSMCSYIRHKSSSIFIIASFITTLLVPVLSSTELYAKEAAPVKVRICINQLEALGIDKKIASDITMKIYKKLKKAKGGERVLHRDIDGISKSANRQLIGRISKLGKSLVITVKVVEGAKAKLIFSKTVIVKEDDDLDESLDDIVEIILEKDEIW